MNPQTREAMMAVTATHPEIEILLDLVDQAYSKHAWHGPNLRGSIRGLTATQAAWRPQPGRHNIAEHVVHTAYWKYATRRRLTGTKRGSFAFKGSNWFAAPATLSDDDWRSYVALLDAEHRAMRATISAVSPAALRRASTGKYRNIDLIQGIACHDLYHAGQIQLLKRLQKVA
jgi:hypothetical protein